MNAVALQYSPVLSSLHDASDMRSLAEACAGRLGTLGLQPMESDSMTPADSDALILLVLSGGTEQKMQAQWRAWDPFGRRPVWLLAIPHHNSLAASLEFLAAARNAGGAGRLFYFDPEAGRPDAGLDALKEALSALQAHRAMRSARLGLIGQPSDWLLTSIADHKMVRETWGPELAYISTEACLDAFDRGLAGARAPDGREHIKAGAMYDTLKTLAQAHRLDALTIRCFDLLNARDATACLALARLNDEGMPAACEGDIPSALGMMWARRLLGLPAWMANPSRMDPGEGMLTMAHCTIPLSLTSRHEIVTHFESGRGTAVAGEWRTDEVTLFRIGGRRLGEWWIGQGRTIPRGRDERLCRTQLTVTFDNPDSLKSLIDRPLGNHLLVIPGRRAALLQAAFEIRAQLAGET